MHLERFTRLCDRLEALASIPLNEREFVFSMQFFDRCGIGVAARDPWAQAQGFHLEGPLPRFGELKGWEAVIAWFEITDTEAWDLFEPYPNPNCNPEPALYNVLNPGVPWLLARRLREYVRTRLPERAAQASGPNVVQTSR
jgi:hypothetical protein